MSIDKLWQQLRHAADWQSAFQPLAQHSASGLKQRYRELAALVHPDLHPTQQAQAVEAFQLLQQWYAVAQSALAQRASVPRVEITARTGHYQSNGAPYSGDLCELYPATNLTTNAPTSVLLKIVRSAHNNDLLRAEGKVLRQIDRALADKPLRAHFPTLIDQVQLRDQAGELRIVNILGHESNYFSLAQVLQRYPTGIAPADAAWIYKRLLAALAVTHDLGLVHGAVTLDHLLIRPSDHNGLLVDWCYSVPNGESIKAVSPAHRGDLPPEVLAKAPASAATDLYMAAGVMIRLLGGEPTRGEFPTTVPKATQALLQSCLIAAPHRRPNNAWELFDDFDTILQRLYGAPKFRPFPSVAAEE